MKGETTHLNTFEIVTGLTVASIGTIILLYFIVLKKKGWLLDETPSKTGYLCPNAQCRKVFKEPVWLTDLSKTPSESFQACPHCGMSIQTNPPLGAQASPVKQGMLKPSPFPSDIKHQDPESRSIKGSDQQRKTDVARASDDQNTHLNVGNTAAEKQHDLNEPKPKSLFKFPQIRKDATQEQSDQTSKPRNKGSTESPKKCSHFFGYVRTLPKNTPIPDECLWCPSIVDCLSREQKAEAEA